MDSQPIHGVIFDLDGTLVHSSLDFRALDSAVNCPPNTDLLAHVSAQPEPLRSEFFQLIEAHELKDAHDAEWINGAESFVNELHRLNIPMAIVTRNFSKAARIKVTNNRIPIDLILTREDAPAKPDPAALLTIAEQWSLPPSQLIYIGDYLYDIQAAANAGMRSCLYVEGCLPHYSEQADIIFSCFEELHTKLFAD